MVVGDRSGVGEIPPFAVDESLKACHGFGIHPGFLNTNDFIVLVNGPL